MRNPFSKKQSVTKLTSTLAPAVDASPRERLSEEARPTAVTPATVRRVIGVIVSPHITEKASAGAAFGWYAFRVRKGASKPLIKRAVEEQYRVHVVSVRVLNHPERSVRIGRTLGRTGAYRKAMVKLRAGEGIELT